MMPYVDVYMNFINDSFLLWKGIVKKYKAVRGLISYDIVQTVEMY